MPVATTEATTLYSMIALVKSAESMNGYLVASKSISGTTKHELNGFFHRFKILQDNLLKNAPPEDKEAWRADWERDYPVYGEVLQLMAVMTDEQRTEVETHARKLVDL